MSKLSLVEVRQPIHHSTTPSAYLGLLMIHTGLPPQAFPLTWGGKDSFQVTDPSGLGSLFCSLSNNLSGAATGHEPPGPFQPSHPPQNRQVHFQRWVTSCIKLLFSWLVQTRDQYHQNQLATQRTAPPGQRKPPCFQRVWGQEHVFQSSPQFLFLGEKKQSRKSGKGRPPHRLKLHPTSTPYNYRFCWKVIERWPG